MTPLNQKERDSLFWQFLSGAAIVVAILTLTIYYTFETPYELTQVERTDLEKSRSIIRNQNKVLDQLRSVNSSIDKIETSSNTDGAIKLANTENAKLKTLLSADTTQRLFLDEIYGTLDKTITAKQEKLKLNNQISELNRDHALELKKRDADCQDKVNRIMAHQQ